MKNPCVGGGWLKRGVSVGMSAVLAATLLGTAPAAAFASEADVVQKWSAAAELVLDDQESSYSYAGSDEPVALSDNNVETTSSERRLKTSRIGHERKIAALGHLGARFNSHFRNELPHKHARCRGIGVHVVEFRHA